MVSYVLKTAASNDEIESYPRAYLVWCDIIGGIKEALHQQTHGLDECLSQHMAGR